MNKVNDEEDDIYDAVRDYRKTHPVTKATLPMDFEPDAFSEEQIQAMSKGFSTAYIEMKQDELKAIPETADTPIVQIWKYLETHPKRVYDAEEGVCFPTSVILEALKKFL